MRAGVRSDSTASFTITAGENILTNELSKGYAHLRYEVSVSFTDSIDVTIHPDGVFGSYSAFSVAVVVLDNITEVTDSDEDGMPDTWEVCYGFNSHKSGDALTDSDNDGLCNKYEYIAGTNPTNSQSRFQIE